MTTLLLPRAARAHLDLMREEIDEHEANGLTAEQLDELFVLCTYLPDLAERSWAAIQSDVHSGVEGRGLAAALQGLLGTIEESVHTCNRLQDILHAMPDSEEGAIQVSTLTTLRQRLQRIQRPVKARLDWLLQSPPAVDPSKWQQTPVEGYEKSDKVRERLLAGGNS
jgi:hypothetical protein